MKINKRKMLELIDSAVEAKGEDFVVGRCRYTQHGDACCIVGTALIDYLDSSLKDPLMDADDGSGDFSELRNSTATNVLPMLDKYGYKFTRGAIKVAQAAQTSQDKMDQWGIAKAEAHKV